MKTTALFSAMCAVSLSWASDLPTVDVFGNGSDKPTPKVDVADDDYVPDWVSELSNLPTEERQRYMNYFAMAKWAYGKGSFDVCENSLNVCESIYDKNPNVWNLRASALLSQQCFEAAEPWLKKVRAAYPDDSVCNLNYSLYYLGTAQYDKCIEEVDILLNELEYKTDMEPLKHSLTFRKMLCLVLQDKVEEARALVKDITPLTFTPLYYYSQCVLAFADKDKAKALTEMKTADKIYRTDSYLSTYKQALIFSKLLEKMAGDTSYTK